MLWAYRGCLCQLVNTCITLVWGYWGYHGATIPTSKKIEDKTKALAEASSSLAQRLYAEQQENASTDQNSQESQASDDAAVDADFEEVKEEAKEQEK